MSTIGSILLTPDLHNKLLMIVKADLDSVPEAHGIGIILPLYFKEKPNYTVIIFIIDTLLGRNIDAQ